MPDDGLNNQTGNRSGDPKDGNFIHFRTQGFKNPAYIGILQRKPKLNTQKPKTHVPDLQWGFLVIFMDLSFIRR